MKPLTALLPESFKKKQWLVVLCAAVLVIALMDQLVFSSLRRRTADFNEKIKQEERLLQQWRTLETNKAQIASDYDVFSAYYFSPESDKEALTRFMREVERITKESGVSVISLAPRQEKAREENCIKYLLDLQLEVTMPQLLDFLNKINTCKQMIMVDSYSISPKSEDARLLKFDAVVSFLVYAPRT